MAGQLIGGIAFIKVLGKQFALKGELRVQPNAIKNESVVGQDEYHGTMQTPIAAFIEGEISDLGGLAVTSFPGLLGVPITVELNNGKSYVMDEGNYVGEEPIETAPGKIKVRFEGPQCTEVLAG